MANAQPLVVGFCGDELTHVPDRVVGVDADKRIAGHGHAMRGSSVEFSGARRSEPAIDTSAAAAADARFSAVRSLPFHHRKMLLQSLNDQAHGLCLHSAW